MDERELQPVGIRGWLILPAIGLVYSTIAISIGAVTQFSPYFLEGAWGALTTPGTDAYHPLWAPILIYEFSFTLLYLLFTLWLAWLFFRRNARTPIFFQMWAFVGPLYIVSDILLSYQIPAVADIDNAASFRELGKGVTYAAVWIPYFIRSKRVKNTFTQ